MAVSSDESGTQEGVRQELVQFCQFQAKKKKKRKRKLETFWNLSGKYSIHKSHLHFAI